MDPQAVLFYVFSVILLFAAFRVITVSNPVHAALFLVLSFFQASGIWMLLHHLGVGLCGCGDGSLFVCRDDARY